jgi:hypothetical protein
MIRKYSRYYFFHGNMLEVCVLVTLLSTSWVPTMDEGTVKTPNTKCRL